MLISRGGGSDDRFGGGVIGKSPPMFCQQIRKKNGELYQLIDQGGNSFLPRWVMNMLLEAWVVGVSPDHLKYSIVVPIPYQLPEVLDLPAFPQTEIRLDLSPLEKYLWEDLFRLPRYRRPYLKPVEIYSQQGVNGITLRQIMEVINLFIGDLQEESMDFRNDFNDLFTSLEIYGELRGLIETISFCPPNRHYIFLRTDKL